jgi:hypothetical protein
MALERLDGIRGTTWIITARGRQQGSERDLIPADEENEKLSHHDGGGGGTGEASCVEHQRIN